MKLYDLAMTIEHADQKVRVLDSKTGRECFNGTADQLLDYSGIDYRRVTAIALDGDVLKVRAKV